MDTAERVTHRRPRVLFIAEAVALSHVARPLALLKALDPNAYDLSLAADSRYRSLLGSLPVPFHSLPSLSNAEFLTAVDSGRPFFDRDYLRRCVQNDLDLIAEVQPDLIVGDFRWSLGVSARLARVPYWTLTNAHWSPFGRQHHARPDHPILNGLGPVLGAAVYKVLRPAIFARLAAPYCRLRRAYGLGALPWDVRHVNTDADRVFYADAPEFAPVDFLRPHESFLGPVLWSLPGGRPDWWDRLPSDRPLVYVNLGTTGRGDVLPEVLAALSSLPVVTIAATTGSTDPAPSFPNVFTAPFLPGGEATRRASLVVCNGGAMTVHQALAEGVPVLGITNIADQFLSMNTALRANAGVLLRSSEVSAGTVYAAAEALLNRREHRDAAARARDVLAHWDAGARFAAEVESFFGRRPWNGNGAAEPHRFLHASPPPSNPSVVLEPRVAAALHAAAAAPSAENSQPLRLVCQGAAVEVTLPDRPESSGSDDRLTGLLTLGAARRNIAVASAPDWFDNAPWRRCTNRRPYLRFRIRPAALRELEAAADRSDYVSIRVSDLPAAIARAANAASWFDEMIFRDRAVHQRVFGWLRWRANAATGLPVKSLELSGFTRLLFRAASLWLFGSVLARVGAASIARLRARRLYRRSAAMGWIAVQSLDDDSLIAAGRAFQDLWLRATRMGLSLQPLAGTPLQVLRLGKDAGSLAPAARRGLVRAKAALEAYVGPNAGVPLLLFRIGYAAPPTARAKRLPIDRLLARTS